MKGGGYVKRKGPKTPISLVPENRKGAVYIKQGRLGDKTLPKIRRHWAGVKSDHLPLQKQRNATKSAKTKKAAGRGFVKGSSIRNKGRGGAKGGVHQRMTQGAATTKNTPNTFISG